MYWVEVIPPHHSLLSTRISLFFIFNNGFENSKNKNFENIEKLFEPLFSSLIAIKFIYLAIIVESAFKIKFYSRA